MIVVDASIALAWLFDDEHDDLAEKSANLVISDSAIVPGIFPVEVCNALRFAAKRGRISDRDVANAVDRIAELPIRIDTSRLALHDELQLARTYDLTVFDSMYLALARRHRIPLFTRDVALLNAAAAEKVIFSA